VPVLAAAGFQVIVPDLRGYGRSGKPEAVEAYSLPLLAGDVTAILAGLGIDLAHMVGHDWGAALAWILASLAPGQVDHSVTLSVGHPVTFCCRLPARTRRRTAPAGCMTVPAGKSPRGGFPEPVPPSGGPPGRCSQRSRLWPDLLPGRVPRGASALLSQPRGLRR
jgi:pimeloyl-ACP methyl ester carboxylesterase